MRREIIDHNSNHSCSRCGVEIEGVVYTYGAGRWCEGCCDTTEYTAVGYQQDGLLYEVFDYDFDDDGIFISDDFDTDNGLVHGELPIILKEGSKQNEKTVA